MKSTYQENQRERSTNLIENSELFEGVLGGRKFFGKERKFVLSDEEKNIFKPLRSDVIDYFTHVSHFPQTIDKEIEGKCIIIYISVI